MKKVAVEQGVGDRIRSAYYRRFALVLSTVLVLLVCLAWRNRFVQDDAFISFGYAHNLADGKGLVWNPGDRLEG